MVGVHCFLELGVVFEVFLFEENVYYLFELWYSGSMVILSFYCKDGIFSSCYDENWSNSGVVYRSRFLQLVYNFLGRFLEMSIPSAVELSLSAFFPILLAFIIIAPNSLISFHLFTELTFNDCHESYIGLYFPISPIKLKIWRLHTVNI